MILFIEPWGIDYAVKPKESIEILFIGAEEGTVMVEHFPSRIVVYGWAETNLEVRQNGVLLN